jgi:hypothetical protein
MTERSKAMEKLSRRGRRLLGQVLVEGGFISRETLNQALERQQRTGEMLGESLIKIWALDSVELTAALSVQEELSSVPSALRAAAGGRQLLGELLLTAKRITPEELEQALGEQERTVERIGEILVRWENLSREELDAVLAFQERQSKDTKDPSPLRLGEILVATMQISRRQLDRALSEQGKNGGKLGELLVNSGYVAPQQVSRGLVTQRKLVTAALVAAMSLSSTPGASIQEEAGDPLSSDAGASTRIQVYSSVLPQTTLTVYNQPRFLVVTREDIRRGFVDVPTAVQVEARSNDPRGYMLVFENKAGVEAQFQDVIIQGLESELTIGPSGGWVSRTNGTSPSEVELSYRFALTGEARPGSYPWPIFLSARPL